MTSEQLLKITEHLIFLSAFLGGFSATFLAAILVVDPKKRFAHWVVSLSAISACSFIVCATSSIALVNGLHIGTEETKNTLLSVSGIRIVSAISMAIGVFSLLGSIGLSGWLRDKRSGIVTSCVALMAIAIVAFFL